MRLPRHVRKKDGTPRRAGFEFEFAGLEPEEAARAVADVFGGRVRRESPFVFAVEDTAHGTVGVELDADVLKSGRYLDALRALGLEPGPEALRGLEELLLFVSSTLVPCEIVLPPIPLGELDVLEDLRRGLRGRKARGTAASLAYAFGMHINVEPPDLEPQTPVRYMRAFLLLHDWLREVPGVDLTRTMSPYIDPFPKDYTLLAADPGYAPGSVEDFARDYLRHSPTRNRPLDMLPLLAHLAPGALEGALREPDLVRPRPALHYRLPDCRVDEPDWTVAWEWERWLRVEDLAWDDAGQRELWAMLRDQPGFPESLLADSWARRVERWLHG